MCIASVGAQNKLSNILSSVGSALGSGDTASALGNIINSVTGTKITAANLQGTWGYTAPAVAFESENLLSKAGGAVAATTVENKLATYYQKVGIKAGSFSFTFNSDGTFTNTIGSRTLNGTYTFSSDTQQVLLSYELLSGVKYASFTSTLAGNSSSLSLLFSADKLLSVIKTLGSATSNSTLQTIGSLASSYDGMKLGFKLAK